MMQTQFTDLVNALTYFSYRANRDRSPEISPEAWKTIFGEEVEQLEAEYQREHYAA